MSTINAPTWGYTATGLTNGAYYSSFVTSITSNGESHPSYFRVVQPATFPAPPNNQSVTLLSTSSQLVFNWNFPSAPQTAKIGWYVVTDRNNLASRGNVTAAYSTLTMAVPPGKTYTHYIQSVNDPGYSAKAFVGPVNVPYNYAYYPFESTVTDSFGVFDLTANGDLTYESTIKYIGDYSLSLEGTTSYASASNGFSNMALWQGFTWCSWLYMTDLTNFRTIFDLGIDSNTYVISHLFFDQIYFGVASNQDQPSGYATNLAGPVVSANTWEHYAFTLGASNAPNNMKLYKNGELLAETTSFIGISNIAPNNGFFGKSFNPTYPYYQGYMDEVGMYNYDLNSNQILQIYSNQSTSLTSLSSLISTINGFA